MKANWRGAECIHGEPGLEGGCGEGQSLQSRPQAMDQTQSASFGRGATLVKMPASSRNYNDQWRGEITRYHTLRESDEKTPSNCVRQKLARTTLSNPSPCVRMPGVAAGRSNEGNKAAACVELSVAVLQRESNWIIAEGGGGGVFAEGAIKKTNASRTREDETCLDTSLEVADTTEEALPTMDAR